MRIIETTDIRKENFYINDISAILQTPNYRNFKTKKRRFNGFLYIESGECTYCFGNNTLRLTPGALIYLPKDSSHEMTVISESMSFTRINFNLFDQNGETVLFDKGPKLIYESTPKECADAIHLLNEVYLIGDNRIREISLMYEILVIMTRGKGKIRYGKIGPAVTYLQKNFSKAVSVGFLAELCYLSEAQFYRLFKKSLGMSPIEYRNSLRIKRARLLLLEEDMTVSEIAANLGFENIFYFSRAFKSAMGVSPSQYRKQ